ncbi:MAG: hypothetical protein JNL04_04670, partial [Rhodospirillaceae bacterium]|nr:hypothetical protein [Rhodospirillaceae bacterium]
MRRLTVLLGVVAALVAGGASAAEAAGGQRFPRTNIAVDEGGADEDLRNTTIQ